MTRENLLIVANSEDDANMLYAVGMFIPDPFIYLRLKGRCHIVLNDSEIERARRLARHCKILPLNRYLEKLRRENPNHGTLSRVIRDILAEHRLKKVIVPGNFPLGLAKELRNLKIKVKVRPGTFFAQREFKSSEEIKKISAALIMAEVGLAEGIQALKNARIGKGGRLLYRNVPLTAEKLRSIIDIAIIQAGGQATHTIVAGGKQACDPHERGYGPLRANQPIVIDVFPRSQKTGYYGDITRTVVKGRAPEIVRKMFHAVTQAQQTAFDLLQPGRNGNEIHQAVLQAFANEGFKTGKTYRKLHGFFHGLGHGLGLDIHEGPRLGPLSSDTLKNGHVITIEPGLYYPQIGGVRLEDVAWINSRSARNLTKFEKVLEV